MDYCSEPKQCPKCQKKVKMNGINCELCGMILYGKVDKDIELAKKDLGDAKKSKGNSELFVAIRYKIGLGVEKDEKESEKWALGSAITTHRNKEDVLREVSELAEKFNKEFIQEFEVKKQCDSRKIFLELIEQNNKRD